MNDFIDLACCILKFRSLPNDEFCLHLKLFKHSYCHCFLSAISNFLNEILWLLHCYNFLVYLGCHVDSDILLAVELHRWVISVTLKWQAHDNELTCKWHFYHWYLVEVNHQLNWNVMRLWILKEGNVNQDFYKFCSTVFIVWKHCGCSLWNFLMYFEVLNLSILVWCWASLSMAAHYTVAAKTSLK